MISFELPLEDIQNYPRAIEQVSLEQAQLAARKYIDPDRAIVVIVGNLKQIGPPIRELKLGETSVLDVFGRPVA